MIPQGVYDKMFALTMSVNSEISSYFTCHLRKDGEKSDTGQEIWVDEIFILKNESSSTHTRIDKGDLSRVMVDMIRRKEDIKYLRGWFHTHYNFDVFWSGTDHKTASEDLHNSRWTLSIVMNQRREIRARVDVYNPEKKHYDFIPCFLVLDANEKKWEKNCKEAQRKTVGCNYVDPEMTGGRASGELSAEFIKSLRDQGITYDQSDVKTGSIIQYSGSTKHFQPPDDWYDGWPADRKFYFYDCPHDGCGMRLKVDDSFTYFRCTKCSSIHEAAVVKASGHIEYDDSKVEVTVKHETPVTQSTTKDESIEKPFDRDLVTKNYNKALETLDQIEKLSKVCSELTKHLLQVSASTLVLSEPITERDKGIYFKDFKSAKFSVVSFIATAHDEKDITKFLGYLSFSGKSFALYTNEDMTACFVRITMVERVPVKLFRWQSDIIPLLKDTCVHFNAPAYVFDPFLSSTADLVVKDLFFFDAAIGEVFGVYKNARAPIISPEIAESINSDPSIESWENNVLNGFIRKAVQLKMPGDGFIKDPPTMRLLYSNGNLPQNSNDGVEKGGRAYRKALRKMRRGVQQTLERGFERGPDMRYLGFNHGTWSHLTTIDSPKKHDPEKCDISDITLSL